MASTRLSVLVDDGEDPIRLIARWIDPAGRRRLVGEQLRDVVGRLAPPDDEVAVTDIEVPLVQLDPARRGTLVAVVAQGDEAAGPGKPRPCCG